MAYSSGKSKASTHKHWSNRSFVFLREKMNGNVLLDMLENYSFFHSLMDLLTSPSNSSQRLLGCDAVYCCGKIPTFGTELLPPFTSLSRWRQRGPPKRWYPWLHNREELDFNLHRRENHYRASCSKMVPLHISATLCGSHWMSSFRVCVWLEGYRFPPLKVTS